MGGFHLCYRNNDWLSEQYLVKVFDNMAHCRKQQVVRAEQEHEKNTFVADMGDIFQI